MRGVVEIVSDLKIVHNTPLINMLSWVLEVNPKNHQRTRFPEAKVSVDVTRRNIVDNTHLSSVNIWLYQKPACSDILRYIASVLSDFWVSGLDTDFLGQRISPLVRRLKISARSLYQRTKQYRKN